MPSGAEFDFMENDGLETHLWVGNRSREIEIGGQAFVLYHCPSDAGGISHANLAGRGGKPCTSVSTRSTTFTIP
jgi:hypothetical protein